LYRKNGPAALSSTPARHPVKLYAESQLVLRVKK
jgi:hypothetical protein